MADSEAEPVTPTKPYHESLADKLKALGLSKETAFFTPEKRLAQEDVTEEDLSASWSSLGLSEDSDVSEGLERMMPWDDNFYGKKDFRQYRQILTFDYAGKVQSPSLQYISPVDRAILEQIKGSSRFTGLPVGCMVRGSTFGSTFAVSPAIKIASQLGLTAPDGKLFQWHLSAAHNSTRSKEAVQRGVWSDSLLSGFNISEESGMRYRIVVHGEEDRERYKIPDLIVRSPPASPEKAGEARGARYKDPTKGKFLKDHADIMLLLIELDTKLAYNDPKRFFVPSGTRPEEMEEAEPIFVAGTPGRVQPDDVPICLGQPVPDPRNRDALALAINTHLMNPNVRGISFGHKEVTNGRQDKHGASSWRGKRGGVEGNMHHVGCFEGVHVSGNVVTQEYVFNRAVSKDDPYLACAYTDYVLPDLAGFVDFQYPGQQASLGTWLGNHEALLRANGLWGKAQGAGFA